jgi:hypothetical protein
VPDDRGLLREVVWQEIFPWLSLFRTFWLALDVRKLLLAAAAIVLIAAGWWAFAALLDPPPENQPRPFGAAIPSNHPNAVPPPLAGPPVTEEPVSYPVALWRASWLAITANWLWLTGPFQQLLVAPLSLRLLALALADALWALAVWSFFGGVITRIAAVEFALEERITLKSAVRHAAGRYRSYLAAPLMPVALVVLLALPLLVLGLLMRLDAGWLVAGIFWPLALIIGVLMALLVIGLFLGWPLMWATISVDATDSFDALSRSYSYVYQRPLQYAFYLLVSLLVGLVGWLAVSTFAVVVLHMTDWAVAWGSGRSEPVGGMGQAGASLMNFWNGCVRLLVLAFGYSFLWTAATAIYFLLRRDADATETDEVFYEDREPTGLPPLAPDAAGVPVLADEPATQPSPEHRESGIGGG